jgi:hypothetical protein
VSKPIAYYVTEPGFTNLANAGVVRADNQHTLDLSGYLPISFGANNSWYAKCATAMRLAYLALTLPSQSRVIFHLPVYSAANKWLLKILCKKNVDTIAVIVDIDGLRDHDNVLLAQELATIGLFKKLVVHNHRMQHYLQQQLPQVPSIPIHLFDYRSNTAVQQHSPTNSICFAGNFSKAGFVNQLGNIPGIQFNLYGNNYQPSIAQNVQYHGSFSSAALPGILQGSFGLVWDGPDISCCNDYLLYNNPHKLSLYLAAGMPVIAWSSSAVADFILEQQVGLVIENLQQLPDVVKHLPLHQYQQMQQQAIAIGKKVRTGFYLNAALEQCYPLKAARGNL